MRYYLDKADSKKIKKEIQQRLESSNRELDKIEKANKKIKDPVIAKHVTGAKKILNKIGKFFISLTISAASIMFVIGLFALYDKLLIKIIDRLNGSTALGSESATRGASSYGTQYGANLSQRNFDPRISEKIKGELEKNRRAIEEAERAAEIARLKSQNIEGFIKKFSLQYSNESGGILDTVFKDNTIRIINSLNGLKNLGPDVSNAIDDVKSILDNAYRKLTDRAYRLTSKSVTGETIQKDLDEAHMRIARINFILKQKGALSNDANKIIQSAQNMVTEMVLAAKRMRTTDSAFNRTPKRKRKKANRLVTHDSMPWSK